MKKRSKAGNSSYSVLCTNKEEEGGGGSRLLVFDEIGISVISEHPNVRSTDRTGGCTRCGLA